MSGEQIVNKVARSPLQNIDLEELYTPGERVLFDVRPLLFQELVLKEKDFRDFIKSNNWEEFHGKHVAIICSADAIVPTWAFMLLASALQPHAANVILGNLDDMERILFAKALDKIDWDK